MDVSLSALDALWNSPFPVRHAISAPLRRAAAALPAIVLFCCLPALCCLPLSQSWGSDSSGAAGSGSAEPTTDVRVGVGGAFKVGRWTPVDVTLSGATPANSQLEIDAPDPDGAVVTYHSQPNSAGNAGSGNGQLSLLFKMGRLDGTLRVRVLDGERVVANKALRVAADPEAEVHTPYRLSVFLVANVQAAHAAASSGRSEITRVGQFLTAVNNALPNTASSPRTEVVDVDSFRSLPTRPDAYDAFDAVLISERFDLDPVRGRALQDWVRSGGHLLIAIGRDAKDFAKTAPALASWLPVKIEGTTKLRDLSPIESFCRQSSRIMGATDEPLDAARLKAPGGKEMVPSLAGPLLCRAAYGLGRVTVFGLDLSSQPLANWSAAPDLVQRVFDVEENRAQHMVSVSNRLTQTGITELATQLDGSLDDFPSVSRFTIWHVMGLLAALVLVVGPLDYLLVTRLLHRPELTWITFPLIALVAAGAAFYLSTESKGKQVLLNQLDIVDVDGTSGWSRAHSYSLLYSPENRRYDVTAAADVPARAQAASKASEGPRVTWHGRPEASFGGMYRTAGVEISHPSYAASPGDRQLEQVPIAVWSTKNLESEWSQDTPGLVESQLESRGASHLGGSLRHHFPGPIEDWIVAYGHQVFRPRSDAHDHPLPMLPDVPWAPQTALQRELSGYLTGATQTIVTSQGNHLEEMRTEHVDYDPVNHDPLEILRMLTFHTEAGGTLYTGLGNGALRQFDWSPLLELNRAVVVGRVRRPLTRWQVDGQIVDADRGYTIVRIVLPVKLVRVQEEN